MSELTLDQKRERVFQFLSIGQKFRGKRYPELCKELGISKGTFHKWKTMYQNGNTNQKIATIRHEAAQIQKEQVTAKRTSEEDRWNEYMEQLYIDSIKPNAPANVRELYAKLKGKLQDKKEITVDFTGSDIARIAFGLERDKRESNQGVSQVSEGLQILPPEVCVSDQ